MVRVVAERHLSKSARNLKIRTSPASPTFNSGLRGPVGFCTELLHLLLFLDLPIQNGDFPYKSPFSYDFPMVFLFKMVIFYSFLYVYQRAITICLFNSLPWKITMLLIGKPSISMGHLYHGYVTNNQRVHHGGIPCATRLVAFSNWLFPRFPKNLYENSSMGPQYFPYQ